MTLLQLPLLRPAMMGAAAAISSLILGAGWLPRPSSFGPPLSTSFPVVDVVDSDAERSGEAALRHKLELLDRGREFLEAHPAYTAQLTKREVVDGELLDEQEISLKCRHEPFSVYLRWTKGDAGREVLYVEGENRGKLVAHDGGWKARLPAVSLSPESSLAMKDSRYPVTRAGFLGLMDLMTETHQQDLERGTFESCTEQHPVSYRGRTCYAFTTTYRSPESSPTYRKSITLIDTEWHVPLRSDHFTWPKTTAANEGHTDEATLIESYAFTEVDFECALSDADFDRQNADYAFR
jgi:hypothetical protein